MPPLDKKSGPLVLFMVGTMMGNGALLWSYFHQPTPFLAILFFQAAISLSVAWNWCRSSELLSRVAAFIAALTGLFLFIFIFASFYQSLGIIDSRTQAETRDAGACLYFSIVTFTTLGYGDFVPTVSARLISGCEALIGYVVMAAMIALLARIFGFTSGMSEPAVKTP